MKKYILNIIENSVLEKFFVFLIMTEVVVCMFDAGTSTVYANFVRYFEIFVIGFFVVEYLLRLSTMNKFRNIFEPKMVIDLLTILPVTSIIFFACLTGSSLFSCVFERSVESLTIKNLPPSSLWSVIAVVFYCYDGQIPLSLAMNFLHSITPRLNIFMISVLVVIVTFLVVDLIKKQKRDFDLKRATMRQEVP